MADKLPKEKSELFDRLIRSLSLTLTVSALYPANHPAFISAMDSLKEVLDKWLQAEPKVELGISPDNILLNGAFVAEENDLYKGVADHLHKKGIIALLFTRGISMPELVKFLDILKESKNETAGIAKKIGMQPHLVVKEVDYSSVLTSGKTSSVLREQAMWQSLSGLVKDLKKGELPESKIEFMTEFLKDPKKAAAVLNAIYKQASARLEGQSTAAEIRDIFSEMNKYFEKNSPSRSGNAKQALSEIISKLDADLVVSLFKEKGIKDDTPDLADEIFKALPDETIANFMSSVMKNTGSVNERIIRVFNRLSSGKNKSDSILPVVTDKLFAEKLLGSSAFSVLQNSIKGLFENHPDDDFISQLYDLTVGTFLDKEKGAGSGKYFALVREYGEFLKPDNLKREKIQLLLNVLWLERDAARFKKTCAILADAFRDLPDPCYCKAVRQVFELFTEKLGPDRRRDTMVAHAVQNAFDRIDTPETVGRLISFIPGADRERLDDIAYVLTRAKDSGAGKLLDLLAAQANSIARTNLGYVLSRFDAGIAKSVISRIDAALAGRDAAAVRELYEILKCVNFHEAHSIAGRLIKNGNAEIRSWLMDEFCPATAEEKNDILEALEKEADPEIKKKFLISLVKTKDAEVIKRLFGMYGGGVFTRKILLDLVTLCGTFKVAGAIPFLKDTLERRPFLYTKTARTLRVQSVLSLARMGLPEAIEHIMKAANDRDSSVRSMCAIALGSGVDAAKKAE